MRASGVDAAIMRVIGKLEQYKSVQWELGNCAQWGSAYYGVLLYEKRIF